MASSESMSPALKLAIKAVLNVLLVFGMHRFIPQYVSVFGGLPAFVILGCLFTLLNLFLRPLLAIISFPFKLVAGLVTSILVNAFFLWVVLEIALRMDPNVVVFAITGGFIGWMAVSLVLGISNWMMKHFI